MTTGEKIASLRRENNYTQEQFADLLGVSRQSISKWENNQVYPEIEKLILIGKLCSCSMDYLLRDDINEIDYPFKNVVKSNDNVCEQAFNASKQDMESTYDLQKKKEANIKGIILTYFSFPPIFGWCVAIYSICYQKKNQFKFRLGLSIVGFIFSLSMTILMAVGFIFQL